MKEIELTQGQVALVDDDLFEELNQHNWCAHWNRKTFYAIRNSLTVNGKRKLIRMHRVICELDGPIPDGLTVDHRDGNGLNNQRDNLRLATRAEQQANRRKQTSNTSGLIGVHWDKRRCKWYSRARIDGKQVHLGYFDGTDEGRLQAGRVYDEFVAEHRGEFAFLNN